MKPSKLILPIFFTLVLLSCGTISDKTVTESNDYNTFLNKVNNTSLEFAQQELNFWNNKFEKTPNQHPFLIKSAIYNNKLFKITGDIDFLVSAENNLVEAINLTSSKNASYLRSLAANYISQHRFQESLHLLKMAEENGHRLQDTKKMLFDVHLELGNYKEAENYLKQFASLSDFDYLIRLSKWNDHDGDLDAAIHYMENASAIAEKSNNKDLMQWSYTNLADFYGHDNQIDNSYKHYLKALALDPNDAYALKGIAWIVYSHERNPDEAMRIIDRVSANHQSPDYFLLKAEIAEYLNNDIDKDKYLNQYRVAVNKKQYGRMYNTYNAMLSLDEFNDTEKAYELAQEELKERPTPQSYDLLAWTYFKDGQKEMALEIVENNIADKTHEPEAQYHAAEIYKANGKLGLVSSIKNELLASSYELGPLMEDKIKNL